MKQVHLQRYETSDLERMLYSYRALSRDHLEKGHFALAKFAANMVTQITVEMNKREMAEREDLRAQLTLADAS